MGLVIWLLRDSVIDPLDLDDETKAQARAMAGEKAVDLTTDRGHILDAAAVEIEEYVGRMFYRGLAGAVRVATSVVEIDEPGDVPAIPALPLTAPVNMTHCAKWDDAAAAFQSVDYIVRPVGAIRLPCAGTYQIVASATPSLRYPTAVREAIARLFAFREIHRPQRTDGAMTDSGLPPTQAGAILRSGATEILRHVPRLRV